MRPEQNGMTCNAVIVLLDCRRGFGRVHHADIGTLNADLRYLHRIGLIRPGTARDGFDWVLTPMGDAVCGGLLGAAKLLGQPMGAPPWPRKRR
jgi:hypothetical protein